MEKNHIYQPFILLVLLLCANLAQAQGGGGPVPVMTDFVKEGSFSQPIRLTGTVEAYRTSELAAEEEGVIEILTVDEGDHATTHTPLLKIRSVPLELQLEQARAQADAERASLEELENGSRQEDIDVARAQLEQINVQLDGAERDFKRLEKLFNEGTSSEAEFDDARERFYSLKAQKLSAEATLERTMEGPRKEEIARARANYHVAQAGVKRLEDRVERSAIRAPYAGFVTEKYEDVGSWVGIGDPILRFQSAGSVFVRINVPEIYFNQMEPGDPISMSFDAVPDERVEGIVTQIIPRANPQSRAFPVKLLIENKNGKLAPGMLGRATIDPINQGETVIIHKDAIVAQGGAIVFKVDRSGDIPVAQRLEVVTGRYFGEAVEVIESGLKPGDEVVVRGNERLRPGQELELNNFLTNPDSSNLRF